MAMETVIKHEKPLEEHLYIFVVDQTKNFISLDKLNKRTSFAQDCIPHCVKHYEKHEHIPKKFINNKYIFYLNIRS